MHNDCMHVEHIETDHVNNGNTDFKHCGNKENPETSKEIPSKWFSYNFCRFCEKILIPWEISQNFKTLTLWISASGAKREQIDNHITQAQRKNGNIYILYVGTYHPQTRINTKEDLNKYN